MFRVFLILCLLPAVKGTRSQTNFSTGLLRFHRVPFSYATLKLYPVLINRVPFRCSYKINECLILLQFHPQKVLLYNDISQTNFCIGPTRLHHIPFGTSPILLHRVPFTAGLLGMSWKRMFYNVPNIFFAVFTAWRVLRHHAKLHSK